MKHLRWLTLLFGPGLCFAPAYAAVPAYPIRLADVTGVVLAAHPELAGTVMEMPVRVESRVPSPTLVAGAVEHKGASERTASIRLHCAAEGECVPFYVRMHLNEAVPPAPTGAKRSDSITAEAGTDATVARPAAAPARDLSQQKPVAPSMRSGQRVSMLIDSGLLHLRLPVTCLQGGAVGSTIRVAGPGRNRVFEAAVIDQATVRGSLQ